MKKLFALLLAACCLFSMTGCATITTAFLNKAVEEITEETTAEESVYVLEATPETSAEVIEPEAPADEPAAEPTSEPTPEPTPEPSAEDIVYTAHEVHLQGADSVGNEYDVTYRIPAFSLAYEDALEAYEDLMEWLMPYIEEQQANDAAGYSILISRLDYEVWVWEDVLTLQITVDTDWSQSYFKIYSVDINTGEFEALSEKGDVLGVYVGHDHKNSYVGKVGNIDVGFTQSAGFNVYGNGKQRGVRCFVLDENDPRNYKTYTKTYEQLCDGKLDTPIKDAICRVVPTTVVMAKPMIAKALAALAAVVALIVIAVKFL